jgi:glycosyltransferase involved in cell wall biosynthesis
VIIPARDYARYLVEAVASVQAQTLSAWECIVVDDGSADSTPALLAALAESDPRIIVRRQHPLGVSTARNVGLAAARGKYVQFLDADDRLLPSKLAAHVDVLEARPDVGVAYGPVRFIAESDGQPLRELRDPATELARRFPDATGHDILDLLLVHNRFAIEAPLVRRDIFEAAGNFDEGLTLLEDWDLWVRVALVGTRFAFVEDPSPAALVRVHSTSASQSEPVMLAAEIAFRLKLPALLRAFPEAQRLNSIGVANRRMELAVHRALGGDVLVALKELVPLAARWRRPRWMIWAFLLPIATVDGGRRLLSRLWWHRRTRALER